MESWIRLESLGFRTFCMFPSVVRTDFRKNLAYLSIFPSGLSRRQFIDQTTSYVSSKYSQIIIMLHYLMNYCLSVLFRIRFPIVRYKLALCMDVTTRRPNSVVRTIGVAT
uniref:Uncharacterized protein n=1 Tax=Cacopsylla melanoneura TaxID=428564 RepID=A0A8D8V487_9HEMI